MGHTFSCFGQWYDQRGSEGTTWEQKLWLGWAEEYGFHWTLVHLGQKLPGPSELLESDGDPIEKWWGPELKPSSSRSYSSRRSYMVLYLAYTHEGCPTTTQRRSFHCHCLCSWWDAYWGSTPCLCSLLCKLYTICVQIEELISGPGVVVPAFL